MEQQQQHQHQHRALEDPAAGTTTTGMSAQDRDPLKEPDVAPQPATTYQHTTVNVGKKPLHGDELTNHTYIDPSAPTTICDSLYIAAAYLASFSAALSFPGVWNTSLRYNDVSNTYVAFAFLFLLSSFPEAIILIEGLTRVPVERVATLQRTSILTMWNILCLIIAIATVFPSYDGYDEPDGLSLGLAVAPACLIVALILMVFCLGVQIGAQVITSKKQPAQLAAYLPVVFTRHIARDLIIANAVISTIVLAFALGSLLFLAPINYAEDRNFEFNDTYYTGAAFTVIFFFFALIAQIISIVGLFPSALPNRMSVLCAWVLHLFTFITALIAWFCQIFSNVDLLKDQHVMALLGWIFALAALCLGIATFCILDERIGCGNEPHHEVRHTREQADIERHRLEAVQHRKQREELEREHGVYSAQQDRHVPPPSHQVV